MPRKLDTKTAETRKRARYEAWIASPDGRAWLVAYLASPEGRAKKKADNAAYRASPKGKAARAAYLARPERKTAAAVQASKRRALKRRAEGNHTTAERAALFAAHGGLCAWCRALGHETKATHLDHVVPLARGGSNAIGNCAPSCESCNKSKGVKDPDAFLSEIFSNHYMKGSL